MIPNKFNMVDMNGIDVIESQGVAVPGLYQKLVQSTEQCRYTNLYNWKFNGIPIAPTYVELKVEDSVVKINDGIEVDENDVISIKSIERPIEAIELNATENGTFSLPLGGGYNPVNVGVLDSWYAISFVDGESIIFSEFVKYGDAFSYDNYIYTDSLYHVVIDIEIVTKSYEFNITDFDRITTRYTIVQLYGVDRFQVDNTDLVLYVNLGTDSAGIVFAGNDPAVVMYNDYSYRQCGRANLNGTLPSIQQSGANRTYYSTPQNGVEFTIPYVANQNFFASGTRTSESGYLLIKNFITEE